MVLSKNAQLKAIVVIPTYNEALNIEGSIKAVRATLPSLHILVVDDNSQDGTTAIIRRLQDSSPDHLFLLSRAGKLGLGTAYLAGFDWALPRDYEAMVEMDANFSHDPKELPALIEKLHTADVVIGSRYILGGSTENRHFFRKIISRTGNLYARTILGMKVRDLTGV